MIHFNCPHCDKAIRVRDEAAGRKGKCLGCGATIQVPKNSVRIASPTTTEMPNAVSLEKGEGGRTKTVITEWDEEAEEWVAVKDQSLDDAIDSVLNAGEEFGGKDTTDTSGPVPLTSTLIGVTEAVCPYCDHVLEKMPGRKKKCPACTKDIYVRTRPQDKVKILVREDQLLLVEEQWSIANGTHPQFLAGQKHRKTIAEAVNITGHVDADLEGVKDKLKKALAEGLLKGMHPRDIARSIIKNVAGVGKERAASIARTESSRAHAEGQLDSMKRMGADRLKVMVEWSTSKLGVTKRGNPSPCHLCAPLEGIVLTVDEAKGMIPRHPNCMCAFLPANVGESDENQVRSAAKIRKAIEKSIIAEIPEGSNRTLAEQKELSTWPGAKREISSVRPKPMITPRNKRKK